MGGRRNPSTDGIFVAHRGKIHQGIHLLLHESCVPSVQRDVRLIRYLYSWFSILVKAAILSSDLLSGPSYWYLERTLSLSHSLNNRFPYDLNHTKSRQGNIEIQISQDF